MSEMFPLREQFAIGVSFGPATSARGKLCELTDLPPTIRKASPPTGILWREHDRYMH